MPTITKLSKFLTELFKKIKDGRFLVHSVFQKSKMADHRYARETHIFLTKCTNSLDDCTSYGMTLSMLEVIE